MKYFKSLLGILFLLFSSQLLAYGPDHPKWRVVNDTVMGGVSSSSATPLEDGLVRFAGILSLENNGGFASIRADSEEYALEESGTLVLKVRGDGRGYTVDLRTRRRQGAFSYKSGFQTVAGEVTEVRLPLSSFRATAFGRRMPVATPLDPKRIVSFGFMLAEKKPGPFRLDVLSVRFEADKVPDITHPRQLIDRSIALGVPLFNRGDTDACAAVYETTAHALMIMPDKMVSHKMKARLKKDMEKLPSTGSPAERAWALRHTLDRMRENL